MISTDFAPNETQSDAWLALSLLFQPWRWKEGSELNTVIKQLHSFFPKLGTSQVHLFYSGRTALYDVLRTLNLKEGDCIAVQAFTCEAVILPILNLKLKPQYIDIDPQTYSMDGKDLKKKITKNTKVIILQHTFGILPNREEILKLAATQACVVIEDVAHGFNLNWAMNESSETIKLVSFGRSKAFSSVFGGALLLPPSLSLTRYSLPSYLSIKRLLLYKYLSVFIKKTYPSGGKIIHKLSMTMHLLPSEISAKEKRGEYDAQYEKGYPNALAILLLSQFERYQKTYTSRQTVSAYYQKQLHTDNAHLDTGLIRFPILVDNPSLVHAKLAAKNIGLGNWYTQVIAPEQVSLEKMEYRAGSCPVAEEICHHMINLPTTISLKEAAYVVEQLRPFVLKTL